MRTKVTTMVTFLQHLQVPTSMPMSFSFPASGNPSLKVPENVIAVLGKSLELQCHFPCKYYAYEKYWCKWSDGSCKELPSQDKSPKQALVTCDQNNRFISMTLDSVSREDEGWYWCGVKKDHNYGETAAVYVKVEEVAGGESSRGGPVPCGTPRQDHSKVPA